MSTILNVIGREILDSRGNPTVEAEIQLSCGVTALAQVPSGASTGKREALEKRDGGQRYGGKGVLQAVEAVNTTLRDAVCGRHLETQQQLDNLLLAADDSPNKQKFGANALLAVSMAFARAQAQAAGRPLYAWLNTQYDERIPLRLPAPQMNVINGGAHANNALDIQEFMLIPHGVGSFSDALRAGTEIFHTLKKLLDAEGHSTAVGDEGGFAPNLSSNREGFDWLMRAIEKAGYKPGEQIGLAIDAAASEFYHNGKYVLAGENRKLDSSGMIEYYTELCANYPIVSIEDGLAEEDWDGWQKLTAALGGKVQLVGDDIFVTNPAILQQGIEQKIGCQYLVCLRNKNNV